MSTESIIARAQSPVVGDKIYYPKTQETLTVISVTDLDVSYSVKWYNKIQTEVVSVNTYKSFISYYLSQGAQAKFATTPHLPILATEHPNYDVRRYAEDLHFWRVASVRLSDPVCPRELARLESMTDAQKAAEYPKK